MRPFKITTLLPPLRCLLRLPVVTASAQQTSANPTGGIWLGTVALGCSRFATFNPRHDEAFVLVNQGVAQKGLANALAQHVLTNLSGKPALILEP